jgi:hypothetical protein
VNPGRETQPPLARLIQYRHQHEFDTPTGRVAQLAAAAKVLDLIDRENHPELAQLAQPVYRHAEQVLAAARREDGGMGAGPRPS